MNTMQFETEEMRRHKNRKEEEEEEEEEEDYEYYIEERGRDGKMQKRLVSREEYLRLMER